MPKLWPSLESINKKGQCEYRQIDAHYPYAIKLEKSFTCEYINIDKISFQVWKEVFYYDRVFKATWE